MKTFRKFFLCLLILSISFSFAVASTDVAIVNSVVGKVEVQVNESWVQVKNGDILSSGSVISTGFKSTAVLYIGESLIEVRALTRLTIEEIREQNQNYNTTMFLDAGSIKADIKKSENKRVGFKVRTTVATASVRGTSGEIYSDGTLICLSGKWAITPPEQKWSKTRPILDVTENSNSEETTNEEKPAETEEEKLTEAEESTEIAESTETENSNESNQTTKSEQVIAKEQNTVKADQDFYDAVDAGAFIVTVNQTITISSEGKIVPPHKTAHSKSTGLTGVQSSLILENDSDLRVTTPTQNSSTSVDNGKGKTTSTIDVTISIE